MSDERAGITNPLARLDAAMESFIKIAEDFMIRTSYQTDKQTSKEIASLKQKRQMLINGMLAYKQKCIEVRKGYTFLTSQLDDMIRDLDNIIAEEKVNG